MQGQERTFRSSTVCDCLEDLDAADGSLASWLQNDLSGYPMQRLEGPLIPPDVVVSGWDVDGVSAK